MKLVHEIPDYSSRDSGLQLLAISAERGERDEVWSTPVDHTLDLSPFCRYETTSRLQNFTTCCTFTISNFLKVSPPAAHLKTLKRVWKKAIVI